MKDNSEPESSDNKNKMQNLNNNLVKYTTGLTKKVASFKKDSKEKSEIVKAFLKEDSPKVSVSVIHKMKDELLKQDGSENEDDNSESKLRKITQGLGKKIKDIKSDVVEFRDESLQSFNDLKEIYHEKAEQKKAIINSFTEEEVKIMRKGTQLPAQFSKQMNTLYLAKRLSVARLSILSCDNLDKFLLKGFDSLYIKVNIGLERFKSKMISTTSEVISWNETCMLPRQTLEDKHLEIELFTRNARETLSLGKCQIDLDTLRQDCMLQQTIKLRDHKNLPVCDLGIVIWVTGVNDAEMEPDSLDKVDKIEKSTSDKSVGKLTVTVIEATGLGSSKLQSSVNPFCQLELENYFYRTNTEIKSKNPRWDKSFDFEIVDPFEILHISVISEKLNSSPVILGRADIRLSSLHSSAQKSVWIALKNRKLRKSANGDSPKIHLKLDYSHSRSQAAISVFQNKEKLLYEVPKPKFERSKLLHNVNRIKHFLPKGSTITKMEKGYDDIIAWREPATTVKYFVFYMFFVYYFHIWWLPIMLTYILFNNWRSKNVKLVSTTAKTEAVQDDEEEEDEETVDEEDKKSLLKSIDSLQKILLEIQEKSGVVASYCERIHNLFHHEETFLSRLLSVVLLLAAFILFVFGLRTVLLVWGINKFTKKLRDPNPVATNEIDNLLLRVPDFEMVENCRELD